MQMKGNNILRILINKFLKIKFDLDIKQYNNKKQFFN